MRKIIGTIIVLAIVEIGGGLAYIYSGAFDVGATAAHWPITYWMMEAARLRSIKAHAGDITPPGDLADQTRIVNGTLHFADHCASCHSAPGVEASDMAHGMYPKPPKLTDAAKLYTSGELFWILKNGIKMSGMPSWGDHSDEELWNSVAFLQKLPGMTEQDYGNLIMAAMAAGDHHMHGGGSADMHGMSMENGLGDGGQPSGHAEH